MTMRGTRRSPASRSSPCNTDLGHAQAAPRTGAQGTTRVVTTPESRHRYPSPRRVDHLHRHTPVPSRNCPTPTIWLRDSTSSAEHSGCELYPSRGSPPDRLDAHIDDNIQAKRSSNRWGETPTEILHAREAGNPLIIKDLDLYPQPPTNTRSPTLNYKEPQWVVCAPLQGVSCASTCAMAGKCHARSASC